MDKIDCLKASVNFEYSKIIDEYRRELMNRNSSTIWNYLLDVLKRNGCFKVHLTDEESMSNIVDYSFSDIIRTAYILGYDFKSMTDVEICVCIGDYFASKEKLEKFEACKSSVINVYKFFENLPLKEATYIKSIDAKNSSSEVNKNVSQAVEVKNKDHG
jgi:hypothetical protein